VDAQVLGDPRRRDAEPEQTGYLAAFFPAAARCDAPGTTLALMPPVGVAV